MFKKIYQFSTALSFSLSCTFVSTLALAESTATERPFIMHSNQEPDSPTAVWLKNVYTEAFNRIGVPVDFVYFPGQRANVAAENGDIDGQFTRIYEYQGIYKNQLRINVPILKLSTLAYKRKTDDLFLAEGWSSLDSLQKRVDYVRGIVLSEKNLKKWVDPDYLTASTDQREGLLKLKYNRTDLFVHGNIAVVPSLLKDEYKDHIVPAGLMDITLLYPYVHVKHVEYVSKLEVALKELREEGLIVKYCVDSFGPEFESFCRSLQPLN